MNTYDILVKNLKNYATHNGFTDVTLGLSGGMDSGFVAVLAADALGGEHVHAIMMKTQFTSKDSIEIARELSKLNHLDYQELDIQSLVNSQIDFLNHNLNIPPKPIVLENIQARLRGQILMAYSNQFNWLVLACSNASESAMGYCTLYGDTCGGISPIGAVYKSDLYQIAAQREQQNHVFPSLILTRAPSAELAFGQKDSDSLPPYPVLDSVLKSYVNDKKTPEQIIASGADEALVNRVVRQYAKSAFKRLQMAPVLSATEETLYI